MITIVVKQQVPAPIAQVSQTLLDHAQLARFFNANITLIKPQNKGELIGGKGAIRQIAIGKIIFNEEIISASNEHICYRIIGKGPVADHQGDIRLSETRLSETQNSADDIEPSLVKTSTQLDYLIQFNGPKWLPDFLLKFFVGRDIENAMKKLAQYFANRSVVSESFSSDSPATFDTSEHPSAKVHSSTGKSA